MLGKRPQPVIGKLAGGWGSGGKRTNNNLDSIATSPRSPLEMKIQSPRVSKYYHTDFGGVGLGIVAALEYCESPPQPNKPVVFARNIIISSSSSSSSSRSNPIPVSSCARCLMEEDYNTSVSCHGPHKSSTTSTSRSLLYYFDAGAYTTPAAPAPAAAAASRSRKVSDKIKNYGGVVFDISAPPSARFWDFPVSDILSSCHLCKKKLHGKDIYMYRGEKGFCSTECRYRQIVADELKEQQQQQQQHCSSEASAASRSTTDDVSNSSPYTNGLIFPSGILAT